MKSLLVASLIAGAATVTSTYAGAGTKDGGGGPSVICNGPDGKVQSAQLLDLEEAQNRYGLTVSRSNVPAQDQLKAAFQRLANYNWYIASDVEDALAEIESKITFLPAGLIMAPGVDLGDSYAAIIPNGCTLAYVGYYESDGTLRVSKDIFDLLSETDRAALLMHEALYKVARDIGYQKDSLVSRKFNGYLFSTAQDLSVLDGDAVSLSYANRFTGNSSIYKALAPVTVSETATTLTFELTGRNQSSGGYAVITCVTPDGNVKGEFSVSFPAATPRVTVDIGNCRGFEIRYESLPVTVKYGNQVIDSTKDVKPTGGTDDEIAHIVSVYLQRQLQIPAGPQF